MVTNDYLVPCNKTVLVNSFNMILRIIDIVIVPIDSIVTVTLWPSNIARDNQSFPKGVSIWKLQFSIATYSMNGLYNGFFGLFLIVVPAAVAGEAGATTRNV